jgi:hypothetical protein
VVVEVSVDEDKVRVLPVLVVVVRLSVVTVVEVSVVVDIVLLDELENVVKDPVVSVVVVVLVVLLFVLVDPVVLEDWVSVRVVQKPHRSSHIPESGWRQPGQKMVSQASSHSVLPHVMSHIVSSMMFIETQSEKLVTELVDAVLLLLPVEVAVLVLSVALLDSVEVLIVEDAVVVELPDEVSVLVMFSAQMLQNASQVCAEVHVGHSRVSQASGSIAKNSSQLGTQLA